MHRQVLALTLFLAGCPSPGLYKSSLGIKSQQGYTLNTAQKCEHAEAAVQIADAALRLSIRELISSGHIKRSYEDTVKDAGHIGVCLIRKPEKCSFGGTTLGPFGPQLPGEKYPLAARKRGCASTLTAWSSICWPPSCRPEWPTEPHCVAAGAASTEGWENSLIHETFNIARYRWARVSEPDYRKLPALFGKSGVESKVMAAYTEGAMRKWPEIDSASCE